MGIIPFITIPTGAGADATKAARGFDLAGITTAVVSAFLVVLCALTHAGIVGKPDTFLDGLALAGLVGLGLAVPTLRTVGQVVTNTKAAEAAHKRLDLLGAPPADDGAR